MNASECRGFVYNFVRQSNTEFMSNVRNILFCLDFMKEQIPQEVMVRFSKLDPLEVI